MMALTRQEKEKLVLELYTQGKTYRQIAEEARICPRDIKNIVEKPVKAMELKQSISVSSQAYKLFSEGKTPLQVAIALNLRDDQVTELYKEYWDLNNLHDLNQVHEEIKDNIGSFLNLYKLAKAAGMNAQQVIRLLKIANNHLPVVEQRCEDLKREVYSLEGDKRNSIMILQELSDQISELNNTRDSYRLSCEEERRQMGELYQKMARQEALVDDFQNNSEEYIKITRAVGDKVLGVLSNTKVLLRYALLSITESIRNNPERFSSIFHNMSLITDYSSSQDYTDSYMYGQIQQPQYLSPDNNTEANAAIIIDEAEKLFYKLIKDCVNKTVKDLTNKTISNLASDSKPSSSLSLLPRKELSDVQKDSTQK
jgi:predicted transcriptional regulator